MPYLERMVRDIRFVDLDCESTSPSRPVGAAPSRPSTRRSGPSTLTEEEVDLTNGDSSPRNPSRKRRTNFARANAEACRLTTRRKLTLAVQDLTRRMLVITGLWVVLLRVGEWWENLGSDHVNEDDGLHPPDEAVNADA